eukprot:PhF_6_TR43119/c0_g1_i1/m.65931/K06176/truD, PUS7; tRNA pseudouridine13 synthase
MYDEDIDATAASSFTETPPFQYLECSMRKQHVAHPVALSMICRALRLTPRNISFCGTKDYIGETFQRIRLENVSPYEAAYVSQTVLEKKGITLYDFDHIPQTQPFRLGKLFGNRFQIILTNVEAKSQDVITNAIESWKQNGFLNYYGPQRFSWFGGDKDSSYYLLRNDATTAAYQMLNYTNKQRSWVELLHRPRLYPLNSQERIRRRIIIELTKLKLGPQHMEQYSQHLMPDLAQTEDDDLEAVEDTTIRTMYRRYMLQITYGAFTALGAASLRMNMQRFPSYLWNIAVSHRANVLGPNTVLPNDILRNNGVVHHPSFTFQNKKLPNNRVASMYHAVCERYKLRWDMMSFLPIGLHNPARPILCKPMDVSYEYNESEKTLMLDFALPKGSYASVALKELMKSQQPPGFEQTVLRPLPDTYWDLGAPDPNFIPTLKDMYPGFDSDKSGLLNESSLDENGNPALPQPLPSQIREWSTKTLIRNGKRHVMVDDARNKAIFGEDVASGLRLSPSDSRELELHVGTFPIPMRAGHARRQVRKQLRNRERILSKRRVMCAVSRDSAIMEYEHAHTKGLEQHDVTLRVKKGRGGSSAVGGHAFVDSMGKRGWSKRYAKAWKKTR